MTVDNRSKIRGAALLEVVLAMGLLGMAALAAIAVQLLMARNERFTTLREQAWWLADARAEAAWTPGAAAADWGELAARLLPQGKIKTYSSGAGGQKVVVQWWPDVAVGLSGDATPATEPRAVQVELACVSPRAR